MKKLLITILLMAAAAVSFAQTDIKVQAPNLVAMGEQFNVSFIISGENAPSDFQWESPEGFQLVWGPQKGTSTSISIINGQRTKSSQTTYTYVLMPTAAGKFEIPSATATVKGDKYTSRTLTIEVVSDGQAQGGAQASSGNQGGQAAQTGTVSNDDIFLRLSLSKTSAMVGETITATLKLYTRANIVGFEDAKFPTFTGFWSQEQQAPSNIEFHRENIGDRIYDAAVLRSWSLIPQQSGDMKIDPAELVCLVNIRTQRPSTGSIFDSFFQDEYQTIRKRVTTSPYTIKVSALPAGAPASFKGGVGSDFKMNVSLTRSELQAHDAASLKVTVTGKGNTSLLEAPDVVFPPDFEVYDTKTADVSGGKTFEYPFIPRSHGEFTIDPVEYTYFDVSSRKYVTLTGQPMELKVAKGAEGASEASGQLVSSAVNRKDVKNLGSDIRFMSTRLPAFAPVGSFFVGSGLFWALSVLLILLAAAAFFAFRSLAARRADVVGTKNRTATKMARKRLSQAGEYLDKNLYTAFYEELHRALLGFVSDKLNMDAADMSKDNISARLQEKGVSEGLAADFVGLIDACEFARYSPDAGHDAMNAHYESAVNVISVIDDSMKRKKPSAAAAAVIALLLVLPAGLQAAENAYADSLWTAGTAAYTEGNWTEAIGSWTAVCGLGLESEELYYNIANAYYKDGDIAKSILYYERALKLNPSYSDAKYNLEIARGMVQDKIEEIPEFFVETAGRKMCWLLPSDTWAVLFILFLAATLAMVLLFLLGRSTRARKIGFIAGIVLLLASALCLDFAFWQRTDYRKADKAVIMKPVCSVKSSPGSDSATNLFVLHEGTKVTVLDEVGNWSNIELADGRQGWLQTGDMEII